jgi:hypothetical protein
LLFHAFFAIISLLFSPAFHNRIEKDDSYKNRLFFIGYLDMFVLEEYFLFFTPLFEKKCIPFLDAKKKDMLYTYPSA